MLCDDAAAGDDGNAGDYIWQMMDDDLENKRRGADQDSTLQILLNPNALREIFLRIPLGNIFSNSTKYFFNPLFNSKVWYPTKYDVETRFQLMVLLLSIDVTKNLTGHSMHIVGPQLSQINRYTNSFQEMYMH